MIAELDKAWLAGIIDMANWNPDTYEGRARVYIGSTRYEVIERVSKLTGISIGIQGSGDWSRKGCSQHCDDSHIHVHSAESYYAELAGWTLLVILQNLDAYIVQSIPLPKMKKDMARWKREQLAGLGWEVPPPPECSVDGCHEEIRARGLCNRHYKKRRVVNYRQGVVE